MEKVYGEKVILRPLERSDLKKMVEWDGDEEIERYVGKKLASFSSAAEWYERLQKDRRRKALAIESKDGEFIGDIQLEQISWKSRSAELRICIGNKSFWNAGYGTDAVWTLLGLAFKKMGLKEIYLRVYTNNHRAIRCYEKCGFRRQGVLRLGSRRKQDEGVGDLLLMGINRNTYFQLDLLGQVGSSGM